MIGKWTLLTRAKVTIKYPFSRTIAYGDSICMGLPGAPSQTNIFRADTAITKGLAYIVAMEIMDEVRIEELRLFFDKTAVPPTIRLDSGTVITDTDKFLKAQFNILASGHSLTVRRPPFDRLVRLRTIMQV